MKTAVYGRIVYGGSAVLLGVIALRWYDADTWQTLRQLWSLPFGRFIGAFLMTVQIIGGIAMQYPRTTRLAAILLAFTYSLFSLACIPAIVAAPAVYATYGSFFEQFCALSGAVALYAATEPNPARAAALGRLARLGLGACAVSFTLSQIFYLRLTAASVPKWIPPGPTFWAILTTIAFAAAALSILAHRHARLAVRLMTIMLALFGLLVWLPRLIAHPEAHLNWSEFGLTFLIAGAAWTVGDFQPEARETLAV